MRLLILLFITAQLSASTYAKQSVKSKSVLDRKAKEFNDSAVSLILSSQDFEAAINLIDKALQRDSNFTEALSNKFSFELELKHYNKAAIVAKKLTVLRPDIPEYWVSVGLSYFISGDSISAENYFNKAAIIYENMVDTMNKKSVYYKTTLLNEGVNLIFAGNRLKGNEILKSLNESTSDDIEKELSLGFINKSRKEIIDDMMLSTSPDTSYTIEETNMDFDTIEYYSMSDLNKHNLKDGFYLLKEDYTKSNGLKLENTDQHFYVAKNIMMTFQNIDTVFKKYDKYYKKYVLEFVFNKAGAKNLLDITQKCLDKTFGIIINNKIISAPHLSGTIENGKMELSGPFTENNIDEFLKQIKIKD